MYHQISKQVCHWSKLTRTFQLAHLMGPVFIWNYFLCLSFHLFLRKSELFSHLCPTVNFLVICCNGCNSFFFCLSKSIDLGPFDEPKFFMAQKGGNQKSNCDSGLGHGRLASLTMSIYVIYWYIISSRVFLQNYPIIPLHNWG